MSTIYPSEVLCWLSLAAFKIAVFLIILSGAIFMSFMELWAAFTIFNRKAGYKYEETLSLSGSVQAVYICCLRKKQK